jgi:hypothetical protein
VKREENKLFVLKKNVSVNNNNFCRVRYVFKFFESMYLLVLSKRVLLLLDPYAAPVYDELVLERDNENTFMLCKFELEDGVILKACVSVNIILSGIVAVLRPSYLSSLHAATVANDG